ncbi:MAG TPA: circularly permuted type 2 ATP-grasp protein [Cellulomonas sp.]
MTDVLSTGGVGLVTGNAPEDADRLAAVREAAARLLADHGVTYGGDDDEGGSADAWRLDPVPVVLDEADWLPLEAAVAQRAELLDAVLTDLYGERRLLRDDLLPPELVLGHPGFLRAVDGLCLPGGHDLLLTATDLCRTPDGTWVAVSDRAQAPSGAGYAMEDRRVVAQVLAEVYRQTPIQRIGPFFHALRQALLRAAPAGAAGGPGGARLPGDGSPAEGPRAVLLTSGPYSETAFDQAYLASMLGLPLVEGGDLVVRDGRVWLRGLGTLEPVDVILRRVDADWCDPLDLRSDSRLGVPGLVRAVQAGTVSVVNPLGASVLENAGLLAHLPALARTVLGTDLLLPQAATTWCGRPEGLARVLAHLDRLVVKPVARGRGAASVPGWTLDEAGRAELAARITEEPGAWVGQEPVGGLAEDAGRSRSAVLRTFAVAAPDGYRVMAGGLARLAPDEDRAVVSSAAGAVARDVWVLAGEIETAPGEEPSDDALAAGTGYPVAGGGGTDRPGAPGRETDVVGTDGTPGDRPSDGPVGDGAARSRRAHAARQAVSGISPRSAESLFWMGRYAERADGTVRVLRAVADRWDDHHRRPATPGGRALSALLDAVGARAPDGFGRPDAADRPELRDLLVDRARPGSVAWAVRRLAEAQAAVRDQMSADLWLPLASMARTLAAQRRTTSGRTADLRTALDRMLEALLAVAGIEAESLVRDGGWRLLDAGRRIERAQALVSTLTATTTRARPDDVDALVLESVLLTHESAITYRRRHQARPTVPGVLDLLLLDETNPRSLAFQVDRLREDLTLVPTPPGGADQRDRLLADVTDLLDELDPGAAGTAGTDGRRVRLTEVLGSLDWRLRAVSDEVARVHFVHLAPARAVAEEWGIGVSPQDDGGAA